METNQSVKASIMAIIILTVVSSLWRPTIAKAQSLKQFKTTFMTNTLNAKKIKVKPYFA